jgi:N-ethylmaleimide reductase
LYNATHVVGWRKVTEAVHAKGGRIFVQMMHTGRASVQVNMPAGARVLAPSAVQLDGEMWTDVAGMQPYTVPQAMSAADIAQAVAEFATSAELAMEAGFDGVELHGANGYLLEQFLNTASNQRTDEWGGSVEKRARFVLDVARAVTARIGAERTGIRLSPYGAFNSMQSDPGTDALFTMLARELGLLGLAYVHVVDHSSQGAPAVPQSVKDSIRSNFGGAVILSGGYDLARAEADLATNLGELVAFGRPFLANPDLVRRLQEGLELAQPDFNALYTPGAKGYTDYPSLA